MTDENNTVKKSTNQSIVNTIKLYIVLYFAVMLSSCADGYNQKPDNKLKKSPCACVGVIYDSRVV